MNHTVCLHGILADVAGTPVLNLEGAKDLISLRKLIEESHGKLSEYIYHIAVNKHISFGNQALLVGDKIDLIPPFAGG